MICVGIDDTDTRDTRGTNQLARELASLVRESFHCLRITRHQLLYHPRIPFTSKNGSASLVLTTRGEATGDSLFATLAAAMRARFVPGSDPGLCVAEDVPPAVEEFGRRCQREVVCQGDARSLAHDCGIRLAGLGGSEDGVIGSLAAVGLATGNDDGRVVYHASWPDELSGLSTVEQLAMRGVATKDGASGVCLTRGIVDVGKKLRPNWRAGRCLLSVEYTGKNASGEPLYRALKLP